jgi:hypothetical protein
MSARHVTVRDRRIADAHQEMSAHFRIARPPEERAPMPDIGIILCLRESRLMFLKSR